MRDNMKSSHRNHARTFASNTTHARLFWLLSNGQLLLSIAGTHMIKNSALDEKWSKSSQLMWWYGQKMRVTVGSEGDCNITAIVKQLVSQMRSRKYNCIKPRRGETAETKEKDKRDRKADQ